MSDRGSPPIGPAPPPDPTHDRRPNYNSTQWMAIVSALMPSVAGNGPEARPARTKEEVISFLTKQWQEEHDADVARWEAHLEAEKLRREAEADAAAALALEAEEKEREEREAKRVKVPRPVAGKTPGDVQPLRPSAWVVARIEALKFFLLDYLTVQGMMRAAASRKTRENGDGEAEGPKMGGNWQAVNTAGAADKDAKSDRDLTWTDMTYAKAKWIKLMEAAEHDEWLIDAWSLLFAKLDNYVKFRNHPTLGDRIIIVYVAEIREEWFENQRTGSDNFDPGVIIDSKLHAIQQQLLYDEQNARLRQSIFFYRVSIQR
jgi:hypothetical protein